MRRGVASFGANTEFAVVLCNEFPHRSQAPEGRSRSVDAVTMHAFRLLKWHAIFSSDETIQSTANLSQKQILKRHTVARCAYRMSKRRRKISPALDLSMFALTRLSIAKSMLNRLTLGDDGRCVVCTELFDSAWFRSLLKQRQLFRMRLARRSQWLLLLVQPLFLEGPTTCHLRESDWP